MYYGVFAVADHESDIIFEKFLNLPMFKFCKFFFKNSKNPLLPRFGRSGATAQGFFQLKTFET